MIYLLAIIAWLLLCGVLAILNREWGLIALVGPLILAAVLVVLWIAFIGFLIASNAFGTEKVAMVIAAIVALGIWNTVAERE